jgi:hypothetical protein
MIHHRLRRIAIWTLLCLAPLPALAGSPPAPTHTATPPAQEAVPAPDSPQAIAELHALLRNAYQQGAAAAEQNQPATQRPVLAAWVEVLRNAILTIGSAAFIAAWGFGIGMVLLGIAALIFALRWRRN